MTNLQVLRNTVIGKMLVYRRMRQNVRLSHPGHTPLHWVGVLDSLRDEYKRGRAILRQDTVLAALEQNRTALVEAREARSALRI